MTTPPNQPEPSTKDFNLHRNGPCIFCKDAGEQFYWCRSCGFTILPLNIAIVKAYAERVFSEFKHSRKYDPNGMCDSGALPELERITQSAINQALSQKDEELRQAKEYAAGNAERANEEYNKRKIAETKLRQLREENLRMFDLVRYMRAELHSAGLLNDDEYFQLCHNGAIGDKKGSRVRLETYDDQRRTIAALESQLERSQKLVKVQHDWGCEGKQYVHIDKVAALKSQLTTAQEQIAGLREALEHCRQRPHEHNPSPDWIGPTHCEVIDRALAMSNPTAAAEEFGCHAHDITI